MYRICLWLVSDKILLSVCIRICKVYLLFSLRFSLLFLIVKKKTLESHERFALFPGIRSAKQNNKRTSKVQGGQLG